MMNNEDERDSSCRKMKSQVNEEKKTTKFSEIIATFSKKKEIFSHCGISYWVSGIEEYFLRCLFHDVGHDTNRAYIAKSYNNDDILETSFFCL